VADVILPDPDALDVWGETLNTAIDEINDKADLANSRIDALIIPSLDPDSFVTNDRIGAASGVASLNDVGQVPKNQLTDITFEDVGAAAAVHQHALGDLPAVSLEFNSVPALVMFNTTTETWPTRTTITASLTRPVIWWGDADVPSDAVPFVDMHLRPKTSGATVPTPAVDPPATPVIDANGVTLGIPAVTVNGSLYAITASVTTNSNRTFAYLQLGVRGPSGQSADTGYNNNKNVNTTTFTVTGSGDASAIGNWTVFLAYSIDGTNWTNGPVTTFAIATLGGAPTNPGNGTPGSGSVPILNRSGLGWNSGVFDGGNGAVSTAQSFFDWRGTPGDSIMYFTPRATWDQLNFFPAGLTTWPGYRIICVPSQPTGQSNAATAAGTNNAFWVEFGLKLKNLGWDDGRTIIRLNWEANGNWYDWAWVNGGASQFVNAWKNVYNSIKTNAPSVKFDLCLNRGNVNGGINWSTQIVDPLIGYIDILGLDNYDFSPPSLNQGQFDSMAAINPGLNSIAAKCIANGLKMSIDEWGVCTSSGGFTGGGDNPFYITAMKAWMVAHANAPLVNEQYFNVNADGLFQKIYPSDTKPNSSNQYRTSF
jgi:hypothetical protein